MCIRDRDYDGKISKKHLEFDSEIVISGIDEIKIMEDNLLNPELLPG